MSTACVAATPPVSRWPEVTLRGVRVHALSERQTIDAVMGELAEGRGGWIVTVNLDHLCRCDRDDEYRSLVAEADLVVADGMPLVWAARLQGTPLPERVAGSDLISTLSAAAAEHGRSLFLLGGDDGAADGAADVLRSRYPAMLIAGTHVPPFGFEKDPGEMQRIRTALMETPADIVYVALGSPKQEKLIRELRAEFPSTWWIGVGISFSFLTGEVQRAPRWVQRIGLEWAHWLVQEPRRLFRRYLVDGLPFALKLLAGSMLRRGR